MTAPLPVCSSHDLGTTYLPTYLPTYLTTNPRTYLHAFVGPVCYFGITLKHRLGYDDALDAFGVHGIGGIWGGIVTGLFANPEVLCVCVCVCVCVCERERERERERECVCVCVCVCCVVYACMCVCMLLFTSVYACIDRCMHQHRQIRMCPSLS